MRDLLRKFKLLSSLLVYNAIFHINELVCSCNFFRKLHPSKWSIVKKISNSSFYKISSNFFKSSCNTIAKFFEFDPIFEPEDNSLTSNSRGVKGIFGNLVNTVVNGAEQINNNIVESDQDFNNWNKLINVLETLKLHSTESICNSIDSWYKNVNELNTNKLDALYSLSKATENTLYHFDSLKSSQASMFCPAKGCHDIDINNKIADIRKKHISIEKEIHLYDASTSFTPSFE